MYMKTKGQSVRFELLALARSCGPVPQRIEEAITNRPVRGWNPRRSASLLSPTCGANRSWGLASGLLQRQDCLDPLSFWTHLPEESKGQNDVPLVQGGDGKSWPWA